MYPYGDSYPFNPGGRICTFYTENVPQKLKLGIHIYDTWYQSFTWLTGVDEEMTARRLHRLSAIATSWGNGCHLVVPKS